MKKTILFWSCCLALSAQADSDKVLLHECNFDNGIPAEYATYDLDGQTHHYTMVQAGLDTGNPWTAVRERGNASNYYVAGTSKYKVAKGEEVQPANDWLVTPGMRILTGDAHLTWRAQSLCENTMKGDTYEVRVSTTGNRPEDFVDAPVLTVETENINQWTVRTADLGKYAGEYVYIAFVNRTHMGEILAIDDIRVECAHGAYEVVDGMGSHTFGKEDYQLSGILRSYQLDGVKDFTAYCRIGEQEYSRRFSGVSLKSGSDYRFDFEESVPVSYGDTLRYQMWVDVEGYLPDTLESSFVNLMFAPTRRTVVEEGTGMWCGYCTLGIVGMERMKEKYPDTFIGIASHYEDILEVEGYARTIHFTEFPMCLLNRKYEALPMVKVEKDGKEQYTTLEGGVETALLREQAEVTIADVSLTAEESNKRISVKAEARFAVNSVAANYRWAFVVVEDKLEGAGFYQTNYMSGQTQYDLDGYENMPDRIVPFTFNDVALSIADHLYGFEGSVPSSVKAGETYSFDHSFTVNNMQQPANVRVVAMLLDANTGYVVNANQVALYPTGIDQAPTTESSAAIEGYYGIDGRRLDAPQRGVSIVRYTNGNTQKIFR